MPNEPRRHHYVSQCYLQQFSDSNDRIQVVDFIERRHFVTHIRNVAVQRDFNQINIEGHDRNEIESHLSGIEGQVNTVLRDIAQNARLPQNRNMDLLVVYVGILAVNNPQVREGLCNIDQENARQWMQEMVESCDTYESRMSELGIEHPIEYEAVRTFVESEEYTVSVEDPGGYYLARVFVALYDFVLPLFNNMQWSLLIAEDNANDFITSDRPAFFFGITSMVPYLPRYTTTPSGLIVPNRIPPPGLHTNLELTMPLNPRMAIYVTEPDNPSPIEQADRKTVAIINKRIIESAERQIYCADLDFEYLDNEQIHSGRELIDEE